MQWSADRSGFPVIELPEIGLAAHLLPVSKRQIERFMAEPRTTAVYGDEWYESVLAVLPRVALCDASMDQYEALFLGGVLPEEAEPFARWLGTGYDLPRADSWRKLDEALNDEPLTVADAEALRNDERFARSARELLGWWLDHRQPQTWGELALLRGGLLEWVKDGVKDRGGLGRPRKEFRNILINPQRDAPARPIQNRRLAYFGFRLVRPL